MSNTPLSGEFPSPTVIALDAHYCKDQNSGLGQFIRASTHGQCERHLWYLFRFAVVAGEVFDGRMLRLFETGHREEERMVRDLKAIGLDVAEVDPSTGEQWQVRAADGHFRGHADGIVTGVIEAPKTPHLLECKTHNLKSFKDLVKKGVAEAKPDHVVQMQVYMHLLGLTRAFYLAKCKDNDEYYAERFEYDAEVGARLMAKAERIKEAHVAPPRLSDSADYFECKFCPTKETCHNKADVPRNCRTCLYSTPIADGKWACNRHTIELDLQTQRAGCPDHLFLPTLVHGEQLDAGADWVSYKMPSGEVIVDTAHKGFVVKGAE